MGQAEALARLELVLSFGDNSYSEPLNLSGRLPLGVFLAALATQALSEYDVGMVLPYLGVAVVGDLDPLDRADRGAAEHGARHGRTAHVFADCRLTDPRRLADPPPARVCSAADPVAEPDRGVVAIRDDDLAERAAKIGY